MIASERSWRMGAMGTHEVEEGLRGASPPQRVGSTWLAALRRRGASAYRAGSSIDEALDACRRLAAHGVASTIGYAARAGESARHVADRQLAAFSRLAAEELDCYVSVKLSALGFDAALFAELEAAAARWTRSGRCWSGRHDMARWGRRCPVAGSAAPPTRRASPSSDSPPA